MRIFFVFFILTTLCTCSSQDEYIIIQGNVKNIPAGTLYLSDAYNWRVFIDSAEYKNDTFSFKIKDRSFEPFLVSIGFINEKGIIQHLTVRNSTAPDDIKGGFPGFMLDYGTTDITGKVDTIIYNNTNALMITPNRQNEAMFWANDMRLSLIYQKKGEQRNAFLKDYKEMIKKYPDSYYLLSQLDFYKDAYSKAELVELWGSFNRNMKNAGHSKNIQFYLDNITPPGSPLPNYGIENDQSELRKIIDDSYDVNMLIFWASWCGPCRQEIPDLKELYEDFKNKGVRMVSISIDESKDQWKQALELEKMDWEQLILYKESFQKAKAGFGLGAIPLVIFTDGSGMEISRFVGYDKEHKSGYTDLIEKLIHSSRKN